MSIWRLVTQRSRQEIRNSRNRAPGNRKVALFCCASSSTIRSTLISATSAADKASVPSADALSGQLAAGRLSHQLNLAVEAGWRDLRSPDRYR